MTYINPKNLFVGSILPNWIQRRKELSFGAKVIYARLCQYANDDGVAFPSQRKIGEEVGCCDRQVRRHLDDLERHGLIESQQRGLKETCHYRFPMHAWMEIREDKSFVQERTDMSVQERTDMSVQERTDMSVQERTDMSVQERTDMSVQERTDMSVQERTDMSVQERTDMSVQERTDMSVQERTDMSVQERTDMSYKENHTKRINSKDVTSTPLIPPSLDTPEFQTAWGEWVQHRHEIRKTLKPTTIRKQLAKLERIGLQRAIAALNHSIEQGWEGIYEPRGESPSAQTRPSAAPIPSPMRKGVWD